MVNGAGRGRGQYDAYLMDVWVICGVVGYASWDRQSEEAFWGWDLQRSRGIIIHRRVTIYIMMKFMGYVAA